MSRRLVRPGIPRTAALGAAVLVCAAGAWISLSPDAAPGVVALPRHGSARHSPAQPQQAVVSAHDVRAFPEDYRILLDRSIFASNALAGGSSRAKTADTPRPTYALRGVMQEGARLTAFVEDMAAGTMSRVRAGDAIGAGRIQDISLQSVVFESSGHQRTVEIGGGLGGDSGPGAAVAAAPALAGTDVASDHH